MKIIDMHIHANNTTPTPADILAKMDDAGIYGGCIFSNWSDLAHRELGTSFDERLTEVKNWCNGYEDRLFPVMWIHPYEENIIENIHRAADEGIYAFKIMCTDFYISETRSLDVLSEIAKVNLPVFFHTGILWDGQVSSQYNRPLNWESLLDIIGLRFSMGHCSWPWVDECIALYGKFQHAHLTKNTAEMFFDLTPGTPKIYRRELLTKLYTIGYDVCDNVLYGTDADAEKYKTDWVKEWLELDNQILDELQISELDREKLFHKNLSRFFGKNI